MASAALACDTEAGRRLKVQEQTVGTASPGFENSQARAIVSEMLQLVQQIVNSMIVGHCAGPWCRAGQMLQARTAQKKNT